MPLHLAGIGTSGYHSEQHQQGTCSNTKYTKCLTIDSILVIGYDKDGADHDEAVYKMLKQCQDVNLKLNREKFHFRCISIPFFVGGVVSRHGVQLDPQKVRAPTEMPVPKIKNGTAGFPRHN